MTVTANEFGFEPGDAELGAKQMLASLLLSEIPPGHAALPALKMEVQRTFDEVAVEEIIRSDVPKKSHP